MKWSQILPSAQFTVMVGSLALSGVLVWGAQWYTSRTPAPAAVVAQQNVSDNSNWQQTLNEIEAQAGVSLPQTPSAETVNALVASAQGSNLTESVGKALLIKLTDAKAQGLGDDAPTQDALVAEALSHAGQANTTQYTTLSLSTEDATPANTHAYGNAVINTILRYPDANAWSVMVNVGQALDYHDATKLAPLPRESAQYQALADALVRTPVPETLAPLHLQVVNDFAAMSAAIVDMQMALSDPLRGMRGVQQFVSLSDEAQRVLTTIAQTLSKDGILFTKDEPGASWSAFASQ